MPGEDESDFQFLAENSADMICRSGMDRRIRYISPSCLRILGWTQQEMLGKGPEDFVLPEDLPLLDAAAKEIQAPEAQNVTATVRMRKKDGSAAWVEMNARLVRDSATGEPREYVLVMRDITGRKREEEKLAAQALTGPPSGLSMRRVSVKSVEDENYFQYLAEHSVDVIMRVSLERVVLYMSPSCIHLLGWKPEELVGKGLDFYILAEDMPHVEAKIAQILASKNQSSIGTARVRRKDKSIRWVEASIRLVRDSVTGEPEEFVNILRDITERKKEEVKLTALALTDGLTGLANRRAFDRTLDREWRRTLRAGSQMSLLLLDVDRFKRFNDRYGHQAGDDCLRAIAAAVSLSVRASDFAARYGGEEIAVILPSADTAGAVKVAEKIRSAIESLRLSHEGNPEHGGWVTASLGVATALARQGGSIKMPESLLLAADKALYEAKHEGRNRVATALVVASRRG